MSIEVVLPGLQTTIQDNGRYGWRHMGVPQSGAADLFSFGLPIFYMANRTIPLSWNAHHQAHDCAF